MVFWKNSHRTHVSNLVSHAHRTRASVRARVRVRIFFATHRLEIRLRGSIFYFYGFYNGVDVFLTMKERFYDLFSNFVGEDKLKTHKIYRNLVILHDFS